MVRCIRILGILQAYVRLIKSMLCLMSEACVPTWCHCRFHLFTCVLCMPCIHDASRRVALEVHVQKNFQVDLTTQYIPPEFFIFTLAQE